MLRKAKVEAKIVSLFVTAGNRHTFDERGSWCVPRQELAVTVQVLLQSRRLQVAPRLLQMATLVHDIEAEAAGVEWQCSGCGKKWTEKDGDDAAYLFHPPDLDRMLDTDASPFLPDLCP